MLNYLSRKKFVYKPAGSWRTAVKYIVNVQNRPAARPRRAVSQAALRRLLATAPSPGTSTLWWPIDQVRAVQIRAVTVFDSSCAQFHRRRSVTGTTIAIAIHASRSRHRQAGFIHCSLAFPASQRTSQRIVVAFAARGVAGKIGATHGSSTAPTPSDDGDGGSGAGYAGIADQQSW